MKSLKEMLFLKPEKKDSGFSLVELMVAVGIITVLASLAVPKFQVFLAKSRQAEAKTNLYHMYTLQQAHHAEDSRYVEVPAFGKAIGSDDVDATMNVCEPASGQALGFRLEGCVRGKIRYTYQSTSMNLTSDFTGTAMSGVGPANLIVAGCADPDNWQINQNKNLMNVDNSVTDCL